MTRCSHDSKELNFGETKGSSVSQVALQEEVDTLDILTMYHTTVWLQVLWRKWDLFRGHSSSAWRFGSVNSVKGLGSLTLGFGGPTHTLPNVE